MPSILFLEVDREDESLVSERFPDAKIIQEALSGDRLIEACKESEIVSTFIYSPFLRATLEKLPKLKLLCTRSVGFNHIDLDACKERGITVCNVPDYGSHVIAEHVFALLLSTLRHIPEADKRVEGGTCDYHGLRGMALRGKTMGIVGTGKIGERATQIAHGFGMRILGFDKCRKEHLEKIPRFRCVSLEELLEQSDIVTLHLPLTDETHHVIDGAALQKMRNEVILVNTARGELIDTPALVSALRGGKIRYVLLDSRTHRATAEGRV